MPQENSPDVSADAPAADTPAAVADAPAADAGQGSIIGDAAADDAGGADGDAAAAGEADGDGAAGEAGGDSLAEGDAGEVTPYEGLTPPDGTTLASEDIVAATPLLRAFSVPDERAQEFVDGAAPIIGGIVERALTAAGEAQIEARAEIKRGWAQEIEADPELGGANFGRSKALVATARDALFDPEFKTFLAETGLGNHPLMFKGLAKAGALLSEDGIIRGEGGQQKLTTAQKLYDPAFDRGS